MTHSYKPNPKDRQTPLTHKVENDRNKEGEQEPTQRHEGRRTPDSRSDRTDHIGTDNQSLERRNPGGRGPASGRK